MQEDVALSEQHIRRLALIREEMRFEAGVLHDRVNALISAEAFLAISFTMAIANSGTASKAIVVNLLAPMLSAVGLLLAVLAWPGVNAGFKILVEWNSLLLQALHEAPAVSRAMWRPSLLDGGDHRTAIDHRRSMLFARAAPVVFAVAWAVLMVIALVVA